MGRFIVKLNGKAGPRYLEWSTIVDAPVTFGMTLEELKDYYRAEYGEEGMRELDARLVRVEQKGTSSHIHTSARDVLVGNRAGPNECSLRAWEIYRAYCLMEPIRDGWKVPTVE